MSDFTKSQLTLALGHHVAQKVIGSDGTLDHRELELLHTVYSRSRMEKAGFVDDQGKFTADFEAASRTALTALPGVLSDDEKNSLMREWFLIAMADKRYARAEDVVLHRAGEVLGWDVETVDAFLVELKDEVG